MPIPTGRSAALDILSPDERRTILHDWNDTARAIPSATLPELFAAQVAKTPDATAVVFEDERLTYRELDARASQLAHHLRALGVGPEVVVGLCVERSPEMIVALLGILKAGGAYLPLDPDYPPERLAFMLDDAARAGAADALRAARRNCPTTTPASCASMPTGPPLRHSPTTAPASGLDPQNPAYVIYTSGSTGTPKGVMVSHGGLINHMLWMMADYPVDEADVVLCRTAISFDAVGWEIWLPLLSGATLCVTPAHLARDPRQFSSYVKQQGVTIAQFVPTLLAATLRSGRRTRGASLRRIFSGGEPLASGLARDVISPLATCPWSIFTGRPRRPFKLPRGRCCMTPI